MKGSTICFWLGLANAILNGFLFGALLVLVSPPLRRFLVTTMVRRKRE